MKSLYAECFMRNIGIFTQAEQDLLRRATIAVAGVGGVGGLLVERLVRLGIGNIRITDLGTFEISNINRQYGCTRRSDQLQKAEVVHQLVREINPEANLSYDNSGIISYPDAEKLVRGADLVIDEMDYGAWKESIYLQRAARKQGVYYCFAGAIGFGALLTNFDPQGMTLEEYNGMVADQDLDQIEAVVVGADKVLPVTPSYIGAAMSMDTLGEILAGHKAVPTCSIGVGLASIMAADSAINIILKRKEIVTAPRYTYIDLYDQKFFVGSINT